MSLSALSAISSAASSLGMQSTQSVQSTQTTKKGLSRFTDLSQTDISSMNTSQTIVFILVFLLSLWIVLYIGTYVFNMSVPKIFPMVKKISVLDFFGLYITTHILFG